MSQKKIKTPRKRQPKSRPINLKDVLRADLQQKRLRKRLAMLKAVGAMVDGGDLDVEQCGDYQYVNRIAKEFTVSHHLMGSAIDWLKRLPRKAVEEKKDE